MSEIHNPKSRPGLTPSEIIRLGINLGHSADVILASLEAAGWQVVQGWQPPETAPKDGKDGKPFVITTAGPEVDLCCWVKDRKRFEDYYFKQKLPNEWPYIVAWRPLGPPADVCNTEDESRKSNGFAARPK